MTHPAEIPESALIEDCTVRRQKRSGPGGQHRNKVETAIVITHEPSNVQGSASERRSQEQNRKQALHRLRINLALHVRTPRIEVSDLWRSRTDHGKLTISAGHSDFPAVLAEALDVITSHQLEMKPASEVLNISCSQLIKLFKSDPRAWQHLNQLRNEAGLHNLK